jgi:hypothetical protein
LTAQDQPDKVDVPFSFAFAVTISVAVIAALFTMGIRNRNRAVRPRTKSDIWTETLLMWALSRATRPQVPTASDPIIGATHGATTHLLSLNAVVGSAVAPAGSNVESPETADVHQPVARK